MATKTTSKDLSNLVINKVASDAVFRAMVSAGQVNEDELYLVEGDSAITYTLEQSGNTIALVGTDGSTSSISFASGTPLVAHTVSEMMDTSRIYIYTGSESGYTNGDWYYYYNGAWVDGGAYVGSGIDIATTSETQSYLGIV